VLLLTRVVQQQRLFRLYLQWQVTCSGSGKRAFALHNTAVHAWVHVRLVVNLSLGLLRPPILGPEPVTNQSVT
jgi:hypothetical protein